MDRRELLKLIAIATGGVVIGGDFFLAGCKNPEAGSGVAFSADNLSFLDEVAETILPKTNTPGAKDAELAKFMQVMVNDCYTAADQKIFHEGINKLNEACEKMHSSDFMKASTQQRTDLLTAVDKEAKDYNKNKKKEDPNHYFTMMKQLTLQGYFTSKIALTTVIDYHAVPAKYDGAVPYKKGDKAFA